LRSPQEPSGRWYEDFTLGETFDLGARTIGDDDIRRFAEVSGDHNPLHLDDAYAASSPLGGRVAHGVLGLAAATGLLNAFGLTRGTLVAFAGLTWRFRAPIRPDETVRATARVATLRTTSKPDRGLVELDVELCGEDGEIRQSGRLTFLVRRRSAAAP